MRVVNRLILLLLAAVLLFSGIDKILHYGGFVRALENYALIPLAAAPFIALPIIGVEVIAGFGLLLRRWRTRAAILSALAIASFTIALSVNYFAGERGICGCWFTLTLADSTGIHIAQNILLVSLAIMVALDSREPFHRSRTATDLPP